MAHPALLTLIVSGFITLLLNGWGPFYKANLLLHPLLGIGFTAVMYYFAWRRFGRIGPSFSVERFVGGPIALSVAFAVPGLASAAGSRFSFLAAMLLAVLAAGLLRITRVLDSRDRLVAICNYIGFGLWAVCVFSGLSILTLSQGGGITDIVLFHRTATIAFAAMFVMMILLSLTGVLATSRTFGDEQPRIWASLVGLFSRYREIRDEQPRAWSVLTLSALTAGVLGALVAAERVADVSAPSFEVPLSTIPIERRADTERTTSFGDPRVAPVAMDLTSSCGSARGCHDAIVQSFHDSNHAISMTTPHMQKSLGLLREEVGAHNQQICTGCHRPAALFGAVAADAPPATHADISCSFCHMLRDVWIGPEQSLRSSYTLRPPVGHLDMFIDRTGAEKAPGALDAFLIRLNPVGHGRQFSSPLLASDRFCESCHHQQIRAEHQTGLVKPRCVDCHMRTLDELGASGAVRSHFMPGANLTVPLFAGRAEAVDLVTRWIDGNFPFSIAGWENRGWERLGGRAQATWLWMLFEPKTEPLPGNDYTVDIVTANVGVGHRFPSAPFDLVEAWLEVRVRDARGVVIFENGFADRDGRIPADAHRLGGRVVGADGAPIEHYRVWQPQRDVVDRVLEPGVPTRDRYTFRIPAEARGPVTIAAEWKYRKLNRDILDWAYGPETTVPPVVVGSLSGEIELGGS